MNEMDETHPSSLPCVVLIPMVKHQEGLEEADFLPTQTAVTLGRGRHQPFPTEKAEIASL